MTWKYPCYLYKVYSIPEILCRGRLQGHVRSAQQGMGQKPPTIIGQGKVSARKWHASPGDPSPEKSNLFPGPDCPQSWMSPHFTSICPQHQSQHAMHDVEAVDSISGEPRFHVSCFLGRNPCCEGCLSPCLHRHCRKWRVSASSPHLNSRGIWNWKRRMASRVREETVSFCTTLMRTHLEYCVQIWGPHHRKDVELMEWVQRRTVNTSPIRKGSGSRACSTCLLAVQGTQYSVMSLWVSLNL